MVKRFYLRGLISPGNDLSLKAETLGSYLGIKKNFMKIFDQKPS